MQNYKNLLFLLLTAMCLHACQTSSNEGDTNPKKTAAAKAVKTPTVEVAQPKIRAFDADILITGTAKPNQQVMVHAMEGGFLKSIYVDIGDVVKKGAAIAQLENPVLTFEQKKATVDVQLAQMSLEEARAQLTKAQAEERVKSSFYKRLNEVYQKSPGLTKIDEVEAAKAASEIAKASISAFNASVRKAQAGVEAAKVMESAIGSRVEMLRIRAPFSGRITNRYVDTGAMIQSSLQESSAPALVAIQAIDPIRLSVSLPESDVSSVKKGTKVKVRFPELTKGDFEATVSRIAQSLDASSKTMEVQIDLPNASGNIKAGMYAKVEMQLGSRNDVLSLPNTAQHIDGDSPFLLVVNDGIVQQIPLQKGLSGKDYFEVLNSNINKDTQVITKGKSLVRVGQKTEVVREIEINMLRKF